MQLSWRKKPNKSSLGNLTLVSIEANPSTKHKGNPLPGRWNLLAYFGPLILPEKI
jgi:hypothetical protein